MRYPYPPGLTARQKRVYREGYKAGTSGFACGWGGVEPDVWAAGYDAGWQAEGEQKARQRATARPLEYTTDDYRNAPSGIGPLAATWKDKPHRLLYELCREVERLTAAVATKAGPPT